MTVLDLLKLLKRNLKLLLILTILCGLIGGGVAALLPKNYSATASIVVSGEAGAIGSIAEQKQADADGNSSIKVSTNTTSKKITVTAAGKDPNSVVADANAVVDATINQLVKVFPKANTDENGNAIAAVESTINTTVLKADNASNTSKNPLFYALIGLVVGFFLAMLAIFFTDISKKPVHSKDEAETTTGYLVLETLPVADEGKRLNANIEFANGAKPKSVCVVPGGSNTSTADVSKLISNSTVAPSVQESIDAAIKAKDCDATVIVVKEFETSLDELGETVKQLSLAKAKLIGLVYLM